jgi:integrase
MARLAEYSESTQKSTLGTIVAVLTDLKDKSTYKALYNFYYERMSSASKIAREADTTEKSDKQEMNWIKWDDVLAKRKELEDKLPTNKTKLLTVTTWNNMLSYLLLSLYTMLPPRRNLDYQNLYVVKKWNDKMEDTRNYYDLSTHKLIFNKYKTSKAHGKQEIDVPKELQGVLAHYLQFHPERKKPEFKLLVNVDGTGFSSINSITRILNKIFDKNIGSTMLRHIYLSDKYKMDMSEMKKDADAMGHNLSTQREYIKVD